MRQSPCGSTSIPGRVSFIPCVGFVMPPSDKTRAEVRPQQASEMTTPQATTTFFARLTPAVEAEVSRLLVLWAIEILIPTDMTT
jgi:hypothetical protein